MKEYNSIIVIGSIAYDEIMHFPSQFVKHLHPDKLDHINVSFVVDKLEKHLGGTATNIAYNISLVTKKPLKIIAGVGKDHHVFTDFFQSHSIDTSGLVIDDSLYTATGKVITDANGNQIWGFYYGACVSSRNASLHEHVQQDDVLILSATHKDPFLKAQHEAKQVGLDYLYDPGMSLTYLSNDDLRDGVLNATWLVGNEYEINHIEKTLDTTKQEFIQKGVAVITTLGEKGALYESADHSYHVPAYTNVQMIDPTGAGDAWRAGFIGGIVDRMPIKDAIRQANALSSYQIEQYGTVNHAPSQKDIHKRMMSLS